MTASQVLLKAHLRTFSPWRCAFYNFIGWYPRLDHCGRIYAWMKTKESQP